MLLSLDFNVCNRCICCKLFNIVITNTITSF